MIDIGPMRRDIVRQFVPEGQWEKLTEDERRRIMAEVNQRMLGIAQGIQLGAAEAQKRVAEAQRAADAKAQAALAAASKRRTRGTAPRPSRRSGRSRPPGVPARRKTALSGTRLDVTFERDGQVVRAANAEVNLPNLLATVLTTTQARSGRDSVCRRQGRPPLHADRRRQEEARGDRRQRDEGRRAGRARPGSGDWIVVSTADPTGSGLRFGIARPVGDSLQTLRRTSARNAGLGLAFIGLALIGIVPISSRLTKNLSTLSDGVRRIALGDYSARVKVKSHDEIGRLASAFNQMAEDVELHQRAAVEQERIKRELELGRQIQHDMLPQSPLRFGLTEIKGVSVPAKEVGGDFFNYFSLSRRTDRAARRRRVGQGRWRGAADGQHPGVAAHAARARPGPRRARAGDRRRHRRQHARPDLRDALRRHPEPGDARAALRQRRPQPAVHRCARTGALERMSSSGLPVGLLAGRGYAEARVQLAAGDLLFFYTDGCVEAENEAGEMFGAEKLESLLVSADRRRRPAGARRGV